MHPLDQDLLIANSVLGTVRENGATETPPLDPRLFSPCGGKTDP